MTLTLRHNLDYNGLVLCMYVQCTYLTLKYILGLGCLKKHNFATIYQTLIMEQSKF